MAISRQKKEELVAQYGLRLAQAAAVLFTNHQGVSVPQTQALRRRLRETGAAFMVVKNRLLKIALVNGGVEAARTHAFVEPMSVVFCGDDVGRTVKEFAGFVRQELPGSGLLPITGGVLAQRLLNAQEMAALADLPSMAELQASLAGTLAAPAATLLRLLDGPPNALYRVLAAPSQNLSRVLQARVEA